jgi:hypothetical protein
MQELRLPDVELEPALLVRAAPDTPAARPVPWQPVPAGQPAYPAPAAGPPRFERAYPWGQYAQPALRYRRSPFGSLAGLLLIPAMAATLIGAGWLIGFLAHATGLQRAAGTAARYGGVVLIGLVSIIVVGIFGWWLAISLRGLWAAVSAKPKPARTTKDVARTDEMPGFVSAKSPTAPAAPRLPAPRRPGEIQSVADAGQIDRVVPVRLMIGAVVLPIGPDDTPDDAELGRWLKMRRPNYAYSLIRLVCSLAAEGDVHIGELEVTVHVEAKSGTDPQPQVISMLPKTSRADAQIKKTVKFGANLKLVEASRQAETSEPGGRLVLVAKGELQQTATWQLFPEAHLEEEKQFLLVVERPVAAPAVAIVGVVAKILRDAGAVTLRSTYAGNPLELG